MRSESATDTIGSARVQPVSQMIAAAAERADRAERVAQHVQVGAPGIEAALARAVEQAEADQVHRQSGRGDREEEPGPDRLGVLDPLDGLDHYPARDAEQRRPVHQRGQDLPPEIAVGLGVVGGPLGDPGGEQAESPSAPTSVSMCPASASSASEPLSHPPDGLEHHEGAR